MSPTIGNSIAALRSTRRHPQIEALNRHRAKIRSTFFVIACSVVLATAVLVVMQRSFNAPVAGEAGPSAAVPSQAPVTCCQLIQNPDRYYSQTIRVRAVLLGYHELALYDPACKGVDKYIRAEFDSASRKKLVKGIAELKGAGSKQGNFWAEVVLVGQFEKGKDTDLKANRSEAESRGHQYIKYRFQLVVLDVEQISTLPPDMTWPP